jgi:hypothetical protein
VIEFGPELAAQVTKRRLNAWFFKRKLLEDMARTPRHPLVLFCSQYSNQGWKCRFGDRPHPVQHFGGGVANGLWVIGVRQSAL